MKTKRGRKKEWVGPEIKEVKTKEQVRFLMCSKEWSCWGAPTRIVPAAGCALGWVADYS